MNANKKVIIIVSCAAIAVAGVFGGYKANEARKKNKTVADVVPVSYMMNSFWGDELQLEGTVSSGDVQKIMQDESMLIEKILVKEGDKVKKGDPIVKYDATLLELDLKQKKNALAAAEDNIKQAKKEITRLEGLKPSEAIPPMPEPEIPEPTVPELPAVATAAQISDSSAAVSGSGEEGSPFVFNCSPATLVSADFLSSMSESSLCADFNVYENNVLSYIWSVNGAKLRPELIADWTVGANVQVDGMGNVRIDYSEACYGTFKIIAASEPEAEDFGFDDYSAAMEEYEQSYLNNGTDDYMYSRAELKKMISEKESELKRLETERKMADVEYRQASAKKINNEAVSNIDGVVTSVNDGTDPEKTDPALVVIQSGKEAVIQAYIGELNLDKVSVGSTINVMSYSNGASSEAKVISIDTTPVPDYYSWNDNPNSSTYTFSAAVTGNAEGFNVGEWVNISIAGNEIGNTFYIPLHYTREEDGRYYVMKAGKDGRLKKQYIKTGKIIYGSQIEVKGGLTDADRICFPYGKNIREGVKTRDTEEVQW